MCTCDHVLTPGHNWVVCAIHVPIFTLWPTQNLLMNDVHTIYHNISQYITIYHNISQYITIYSVCESNVYMHY